MIRNTCAAAFFGMILVIASGCAGNHHLDKRSPSEVFLDVVAGFFEESEYERFDRLNRESFEKRQSWQCENLSESQLSEMGINK